MKYALFGGLSILISGFVSIVSAVIYLGTTSSNPFVTQSEITMTATIDSIFALAVIVGGIAGILRRAFKLTIAGGCIGVFEGIGFSMSGLWIVILILSIIGIVLVVMGRDEFGARRKSSVRYSQQSAMPQSSKSKKSDEPKNSQNAYREYMMKKNK